MTGILALWNDCRAGHEDAYEAWYRDEHLPERLAVPGFRLGRRYRAETGAPRFFTYYEVDGPEVLTSAAYLARVNDPTPRTRAIMSESFMNMSRTICRVAARAGRLRGAWAVAAETSGAPDAEAVLADIAARPGVARAELWLADASAASVPANAETALRGGDDAVAGCVFVDVLDRETAGRMRDVLSGTARGGRLGPLGEARVYALLCSLERGTPPDG